MISSLSSSYLSSLSVAIDKWSLSCLPLASKMLISFGSFSLLNTISLLVFIHSPVFFSVSVCQGYFLNSLSSVYSHSLVIYLIRFMALHVLCINPKFITLTQTSPMSAHIPSYTLYLILNMLKTEVLVSPPKPELS